MADEIELAPAPPAKPARIIDRIGVPEIIDLTLIFGLFFIICLWIVFKPDPNNQLLTALITAWSSMTAVIVSFHRGSSSGSKSKDERPAAPAPIAPSPAPVTPWWLSLTSAEKTAIATSDDPRVKTIMAATIASTATTDDLAYLVTANLLTAERAAAIKAT